MANSKDTEETSSGRVRSSKRSASPASDDYTRYIDEIGKWDMRFKRCNGDSLSIRTVLKDYIRQHNFVNTENLFRTLSLDTYNALVSLGIVNEPWVAHEVQRKQEYMRERYNATALEGGAKDVEMWLKMNTPTNELPRVMPNFKDNTGNGDDGKPLTILHVSPSDRNR